MVWLLIMNTRSTYDNVLSLCSVVFQYCSQSYMGYRKNFEDGWERDGASIAVFVNGKKQDTMSITFSTTKAVAAVCVAMLVDRGRLKYDDLVSKYWPGFAKHVRSQDHIVCHLYFKESKKKVEERVCLWREYVIVFLAIDYYIGLPAKEEHRVARITVPSAWDRLSEVIYDWRVSVYFLSLWKLIRGLEMHDRWQLCLIWSHLIK
uniref:Beta-lactamase domain-containing protein n=1 Tax=Heterorhabditis bacteriophora TaxID=37862 RepID=A0A1I7X4R7_HETBA